MLQFYLSLFYPGVVFKKYMYTQSSWNWKKENHSKDFVYLHILLVLPVMEAAAGDALAVFTFFQPVGS